MSYCKENIFFAIFGENIYSSIFLLPYSHQLTVEIKKNKDLEELIDRAAVMEMELFVGCMDVFWLLGGRLDDLYGVW